MLKVMKNDWQNGWNSVKITLIAAVILSVVVGALLGFIGGEPVVDGTTLMIQGEENMDIFVMIITLSWFGVMVALLVLTLVTIFRNMYGRMFGPEGFLTHTLPVETWELLAGKALGTWLFGVFMVIFAIASVLLLFFSAAAGTGAIGKLLVNIIDLLPKLGSFHLKQFATGIGYTIYAFCAFLAWSLLLVVQFQFICIAAQQFGKYHAAGGIVIFFVLVSLEGNLNRLLSMGFVVTLVCAAACFYLSHWLLKHRLRV